MARSVDAATLARLQAGTISRTEMLLFDLPSPSGLIGFFSGIGTFEWSGVTFTGAGTLFEIDTIGSSMDGSAVPLVIRLNGDARAGLTPTVLATIESVQYRGRPVTVYRRYMHPETYAELSTELIYRGKIDTMVHKIQEGEQAVLECHTENVLIDLARSGYRMRSDADQRLIDANDGSMRFTSTVPDFKIDWGSAPERPQRQKRKKFLGLF
jgi:hypothetical protein